MTLTMVGLLPREFMISAFNATCVQIRFFSNNYVYHVHDNCSWNVNSSNLTATKYIQDYNRKHGFNSSRPLLSWKLTRYINEAGSKVEWTETGCLRSDKFVGGELVVGTDLFSYPVWGWIPIGCTSFVSQLHLYLHDVLMCIHFQQISWCVALWILLTLSQCYCELI